MNGLQALARSRFAAGDNPATFSEWAGLWSIDNMSSFLVPSLASPTQELPDQRYPTMIAGILARNGLVYACEALRVSVFGEARPMFQQLRKGKPGELFATADLRILERPWPGGTFGQLASRALLSTDLAGTAYIARRAKTPNRIEVLRPDWMTIVSGVMGKPELTAWNREAEVLAYAYQPGGPGSPEDVEYLDPSEVAQFSSLTPDPLSPAGRGVPWIYPVLRDLMADQAAMRFKQAFFDNGATPSLIISIDKSVVPEKWREWIKIFKEKHEGARNAYKTLYLGAGATATVVGAAFDKLDFAGLSSSAELRVTGAAGVPAVLVGVGGGAQARPLGSNSDYPNARRRFGDGTMRPAWRELFAALETIVPPPAGSRLWYDDDIPFLREDIKDAAEIDQLRAQTVVALIRDGFRPNDAVRYAMTSDLNSLVDAHSGYISVQVQPIQYPPEGQQADPNAAPALGNGAAKPPAQVASGWYQVPQLAEGKHGAEPMATAGEIRAKKAELEAAGMPSGYDTLARIFAVSRDTIRRRLSVA